MVEVSYHDDFQKAWRKLDFSLQNKVKKQIVKGLESPEIGKPMRFERKGTREVYIPPFRLSYEYIKEKDKVIILDLYHKDEQ